MLQLNDHRLLLEYHRNELPVLIAAAERSRQHARLAASSARYARITCEVCDLLWHLGHLLATAGQRLERRYASFHMHHDHA